MRKETERRERNGKNQNRNEKVYHTDGEYHKKKGRVILPAEFYAELGEEQKKRGFGHVFLDGCDEQKQCSELQAGQG